MTDYRKTNPLLTQREKLTKFLKVPEILNFRRKRKEIEGNTS